MSVEQAEKFSAAAVFVKERTNESHGVREAFANWYMLSDWDDPAAAWRDYQAKVLGRNPKVVVTATIRVEVDRDAWWYRFGEEFPKTVRQCRDTMGSFAESAVQTLLDDIADDWKAK
jgi:hypothetical protein